MWDRGGVDFRSSLSAFDVMLSRVRAASLIPRVALYQNQISEHSDLAEARTKNDNLGKAR